MSLYSKILEFVVNANIIARHESDYVHPFNIDYPNNLGDLTDKLYHLFLNDSCRHYYQKKNLTEREIILSMVIGAHRPNMGNYVLVALPILTIIILFMLDDRDRYEHNFNSILEHQNKLVENCMAKLTSVEQSIAKMQERVDYYQQRLDQLDANINALIFCKQIGQ